MVVFRFGKSLVPTYFCVKAECIGSEVRTTVACKPLAPIIMKLPSLILTFLICSFNTFGQNEFGIKCNLGISKLTEKFDLGGPIGYKFLVMPSGHCGLYYNCHTGKSSIIGTELLFIQIEGKEKYKLPVQYNSDTNQRGFANGNVWRHISYLGLPVYYGFKIKKINLNAGFQVNFVLKSSGRSKGNAPNDHGGVVRWDNHSNKLYIDNYDYGVRGGINYNHSDKFAFEGTYYYSLNNILSDNNNGVKWKIQQLTIGLRYKFLQQKRNK